MKLVFPFVSLLVGTYYFWAARSAGYPFDWNKDQPGYYNYLGRGFAAGHLYLPVEPLPELLAQRDPWDPKVDDSLKLFDAVLYNRRYYLYHGAGPAVMLFAPFRLITRRDLPENFALCLFCFGGFLFSAGAMVLFLQRAGTRPKGPLLAAMLLALGICQCVPFLLSRVWVYEVAVGAGYFCVAGAVFCLVRGLTSGRVQWLIASGFMFGMAIACRPHLGLAGVLALGLVGIAGGRKRVVALAVPFVLLGALVAVYNFERFGDPLEFGTKWQLTGNNEGRLKLAAENAPPGIYYLLFARPVFSPVFPWVELPWPPREFPRPEGYYAEQTVGGVFLAPFLIGLPLVFFVRRDRLVLWFLVVMAAGVLVFIAMTGWSTQRYEVDFLPWVGLAALVAWAEFLSDVAPLWRMALAGLLVGLIVFGGLVNLALGISGPYWEMVKNKPRRFVRIAGWFSPVERYRPVLNPLLDVQFSAVVKPGPDHVRDELLRAGRYPFRYEVFLESVGGKPRLFSGYAGVLSSCELAGDGRVGAFRVRYLPEAGEMRISRDGVELVRQRVEGLVSAPSQVLVRGGF